MFVAEVDISSQVMASWKIPWLVEFELFICPSVFLDPSLRITLGSVCSAELYLHTATVVLERSNHPQCEIRRGV